MYPYWLMFLATAIGVAIHRPNPDPRKAYGLLIAAGTGIALMMGLRFQVGGDWEPYLEIFRAMNLQPFHQVVTYGEAGYYVLNWLVVHNGGDIWQVNLVCAAIFMAGVIRFARSQPDPWLVLVVAIPYLIVVVGFGYTRQAAAFGFLFAGLSPFLRHGNPVLYALYVGGAALFHSSAVIMFPLVALASPRNRLINALLAIGIGLSLYTLFLADTMDLYVKNYVESGYASQGAAIRIAQSAVAAVLFLTVGKRLGFNPVEFSLWRNMTFATLLLVVALGLSPSSTAVDRVALYVLPLQLAVLGRIPMVLGDWRTGRAGVVLFSAVVLGTWMNFAVFASFWIPYRIYPL